MTHQRADELAERRDRQHVAVSDRGHRDDGPPERVRDGLELRAVVVVDLGEVDGAREENDADEQEEDEQAELARRRQERRRRLQ